MDPNHIPTTTNTNEDQNSKTTPDEPDQTTEMGSGRSYECVFCKRGFTTAQALGGHMNIHRKDRVKTKPNTTNNPSKPEPFSHHSTLRPTTTTTPLISTSHHQSFQTCFPTSSTWCLGSTTTSTTTPPHDHQLAYVHNTLNNNSPQALNTFKENWTNISLTSRSPAPDLTDRQDKKSDGNGDDDDDDNDDELDLELRLGHDR